MYSNFEDKAMFIEKVKECYDTNEPIFTDELLSMFNDYSRAQVFRLIEEAKSNNELIQFDRGVYYIPKITFWGESSSLSLDAVIEKKYLKCKSDIYGVYGGIKLLNLFSATTQMASTIEVVTNKETTWRRKIKLKGRTFLLRKPRYEITNSNYAEYMILQMYSDLEDNDRIDENARTKIRRFCMDNGIHGRQLLNSALQFPKRTISNLVKSGLIDELA